MTIPILVFVASLIATLAGWYACGPIPGVAPRGVLRAAIVAIFIAPGFLVGHGFAIVPGLFALAVQPNPFTPMSMALVFAVGMAVIFAVPGLRRHRNPWPPSMEEVLLRAYAVKFFFIGLIAAALLAASIFADDDWGAWLTILKYSLFFGAALVNLLLCRQAVQAKQAQTFLVPIAFVVPSLIAGSPTAPFVWYTGGVIGGLVGGGRRRIAAWISLGGFGLLAADGVMRSYQASIAASHVTIGGGVYGNAAAAAIYAVLGVLTWWVLKRENQDG